MATEKAPIGQTILVVLISLLGLFLIVIYFEEIVGRLVLAILPAAVFLVPILIIVGIVVGISWLIGKIKK